MIDQPDDRNGADTPSHGSDVVSMLAEFGFAADAHPEANAESGAAERSQPSWFAQLQAAASDESLGAIGRFEDVNEIARGGQGIVYRAIDPTTQRIVALKVLRAGRLASASTMMRFEREIEAVARLDHPSVVTLFGAEIIDGRPTLIMQWVDGRTCVQWASEHGTEDIIACMIELSHGVQHAHQRGIIHRDLKPSNVLVDENDRPRVLDFGLALFNNNDDHAGLTRDGQFLGTMQYAAPEQRDCGSIDVRTDIYALGRLLSECLDQSPDARADEDLLAIAAMAMESDPEDRYQSVESFGRDLVAWRRGETVAARRPGRTERVIRIMRRHPRTSWMTIATVVAFLTLTISLAIQTHRQQQSTSTAQAVQRLFESVMVPDESGTPMAHVSLRDILENLARKVSAAHDLPALTSAEMYQAIADRYAMFSDWSESARYASRARELALHEGDDGNAILARSTRSLATAAATVHRRDAHELATEALERAIDVYGPDHAEHAMCLALLAFVHARDGSPGQPAVLAMLEQALDVLERAGEPESKNAGVVHRLYAEQLANAGRIDDAVKEYVRADEMLRTLCRADDAQWVMTIVCYAHALHNAGRKDDAHAVITAAMEHARDDRCAVAEASLRWELGNLMFLNGNAEDAMQCFDSAMKQWIREYELTDAAGDGDAAHQWDALLTVGSEPLLRPLRAANLYSQVLVELGRSDEARTIRTVTGLPPAPFLDGPM